MRDMPRILLIKTSSLGDVVHNLPVVADIRAHLPQAHIDWVVEESFAAVPRLHIGVDRVIPVAVRRWRRALGKRSTWREIGQLRETLDATSYDAIIDSQGLLKSTLIGLFAHGCRHGQDWQSAREPLASLFYERKHPIPRGRHAVVRNRELAAAALGYHLPATPPDYGIASSATPTQLDGLPSDYVVGLHASSRASKLWPTIHWIALGHYLAAQGIGLLLPWHSATEHERAQDIASQVAGAVVLPRLTLDAIAAVLAQARGAVGVDTGLTHLAVALGIPTVALYTDTEPALTGVHAGAAAPAVNLGGKSRPPSPQEAIAALQPLLALPA